MAIDACVSQYASVCSLSVSVLKLSASSCTNPVVPTRSTSAEFSAPTAAHVNTKNSAVRKVPPRPTMLSRVSQWWGRLQPGNPLPGSDSSPPRLLPPSLHHRQHHRAPPVHPLRRLHIIRRLRLKDVRHELLRIPVVHREPRALHLHHDPVPLHKRVRIRVQIDRVLHRLARRHRLRLLETIPEPRPQNFVRDRQLIPRQLLPIVRIHVDQLHHPIAIRPARRRHQFRYDVPRHPHVFLQRRRLPRQHVRTMIHEPLILHQPHPPRRPRIRRRHRPRTVRHRGRRIAHVLIQPAAPPPPPPPPAPESAAAPGRGRSGPGSAGSLTSPSTPPLPPGPSNANRR